MIKYELTPEQDSNLRALVIAGAKSPHTDGNAVVAAGLLLIDLERQLKDQHQQRPSEVVPFPNKDQA